MPRPLTFLSDYGLADEFVGVVHAVIAQLCPDARVIDLTHGVPRQDVLAGALALERALPYAPAGVHLAVVDPEVLLDLRAGRVRVVPAVVGLEPGRVCLADGTQEEVDAVVAATGFRPGLEGMVGHLGVLDTEGLPTAHDEQPALPGLRFVNFRMRPGLLLAAGGRARRTADAIARELA